MYVCMYTRIYIVCVCVCVCVCVYNIYIYVMFSVYYKCQKDGSSDDPDVHEDRTDTENRKHRILPLQLSQYLYFLYH
jgi:hypothetical protein